MTKNDALAVLAFLGLTVLAACRHPADYQGARDRAGAAHQSLDQESAKPEYNPGDSQ